MLRETSPGRGASVFRWRRGSNGQVRSQSVGARIVRNQDVIVIVIVVVVVVVIIIVISIAVIV
jgi:subtilase family serine protease